MKPVRKISVGNRVFGKRSVGPILRNQFFLGSLVVIIGLGKMA